MVTVGQVWLQIRTAQLNFTLHQTQGMLRRLDITTLILSKHYSESIILEETPDLGGRHSGLMVSELDSGLNGLG